MFFFRRYYRLNGVSRTFYMGGMSTVSSDLVAGAYAYIGKNCLIYPRVIIGDYSMLANNVSILGDDHFFRKAGIPIIFSGRPVLKETLIGKDVWIGMNSIILTGINIGDGVVIAAGAVVTKNCEPFGIYGGVPARKIGNRFNSSEELNVHKEMLKGSYKDLGYGVADLC